MIHMKLSGKHATDGREFTIIDKDVLENINHVTWRAHWSISKGIRRYFVSSTINGKHVKLARYIMGVTDPRLEVDHKNHNPFDNRKENLRVGTKQQNSYNKRSKEGSTSKYLGVYQPKNSKKWHASIGCNGKKKYLGSFDLEENAAKAYDKAAIERDPEFVNLNFKDDA